ncbi:MAG: Gfo/Idh/MocA family oxidoreductase [Pirellulaceae bacterium]
MKYESVKNQIKHSRRAFLKASAMLGAVHVVPASVLGANAPSNRINMGIIGTGTRGLPDMRVFMRNEDVQIMAICDVNTASHGYRDESKLMGRKPALEVANKYYADKKRSGRFQGVAAYNDFREIIQRPDIDAVAIVTPDHWHRAMTVMAAEAGKDIYCQKPMTLTIRDGQDMIHAVRKNNCVFQTGSQYRSHPAGRHACELVRNGRIGELKTIRTYIGLNNKSGPGPGWEPMPVPEGFDYNLWLGPAPDAPYHELRCIYKFRFILDYSGGQITNLGAHANDIAQWGNGTSLTGPVEVEPLHVEWPPKGSLFTTALRSGYRLRYANGVELIQESSEEHRGTRFEGSKGWVHFLYRQLTTNPASLKTSTIGPDEIRLPKPIENGDERDYYANHVRNFLDCVKTREEPIEPVEVGHRTATLCHLGNIALQLNRKLKWDPEKERFPDDEEANGMMSRPDRDWRSGRA